MSILKKTWFILFLLIPLFRPGIVLALPAVGIFGFAFHVNDLFNFWRIVSVSVLVILFIYNRQVTKLLIPVVAFFVILLISTVYNSGSIVRFMNLSSWVIGICLLFSMGIEENTVGFLRIVSRYLGLLFLVNIVLLFVFQGEIIPGVMQGTFFFGHRNDYAPISTLAILSTAAYSHLTKKYSLISLLIIAAIILTHFVFAHFTTWSATAFTVDLLLVICILMVSFKRFLSILHFPVLFSINIFLFFFIIVFRMQEFLDFFIQGILGRSLYFTGRTFIWDDALDMVAQAPILGHGMTEERLVLTHGDVYTHAHNIVYETLLQGGYLALFALLAIIIMSGYALSKHRKHPVSAMFSAGVFVALIVGLMRALDSNPYLFAILTLSFHVDRIIAAEEARVIDGAYDQPEKNSYSMPTVANN